MTTLAFLTLTLMAAQLALKGRARRRATCLLRPADEWTGEDVRRWLALIEPFPLGNEEPERRL